MSSRAEKTHILREIIQNLNINSEEKDLYSFSLDILDNENFNLFFQKIMSDVHTSSPIKTSIF